jgi:hypothetical protein
LINLFIIGSLSVSYLLNIKKLAYGDALNIMKNWLDSCDKIRPLDFNANIKIRDALRAVTRVGYLPMAFNDLKAEDGELYKDISDRFGNASSQTKR